MITLCIVWYDFSDNTMHRLVWFPWQHCESPGLICTLAIRMVSRLFLSASDDNIELYILCQNLTDPKCNDTQTVNGEKWLKQLHLEERYAYKTFFVCVPKVFNKTNENILRTCNHFLKMQQSDKYHNISIKFIFV